MRSIQTKFIALILGCVLLSSIVIGGVGIVFAKRAVDKDSAQIVNLLCSEKVNTINTLLLRVEQSVTFLYDYTLGTLDSVERLKTDNTYLEEYTNKLEFAAKTAANSTEGAVAVYVRFNPEFAAPTAGLFWGKTEQDDQFKQLAPTDLSKYNKTDVSYVGWYYITMENGKAIWIAPYFNKNINMEIVSYVIPIYKDGEAIGVVGMDLDFGSIKNLVANTHVYESGYGFLTDENGKVIYHSQLPMNTPMGSVDTSLQPIGAELKKKSSGETLFSYSWRGEEKKMAFRALRNGMRMVLTVPETEINALKDDLVFQISTALLLISFISVILTIVLTKRMIRPLKELTVAAKKIADGNLDVFIKHHAKDEVGTLADSFEQTATHLKKYIDDINRLAYQDILTGVRNKTAYFEVVKRLEEKIAEEKIRLGYPKFAVVMFDINGLKEVNDTLGHDFGDLLIRDACKIISDVFKQNQVYRIGGDEFVIILEQKDYEQYPELSERFKEAIDAFNRQDRQTVAVSIASGIAYYDKAVDNTFGDVFKRADSAMYKNKAAIKS